MTKQLYLEDTYRFHFDASIQDVGNDEKGVFIILDQSAFYPQGGGQPSDIGTAKNDRFETNVIRVANHNNLIKHYVTSSIEEIQIGSVVDCVVNKEKRLIHARYHTAAHLLGNVAETINTNLKAVKGHSFPGEAYVEFIYTSADDCSKEETDATTLQQAVNDAIQQNYSTKIFESDPRSFQQQFYQLPYQIPENKKFRVMQIGDMPPVPCGGTHLSFIGEIGNVKINKIKAKNNSWRVSYEVA